MRKLVWLDVDGVLLDFIGPFLRFIESPLNPEDIVDYDLRKIYLYPEQFFVDLDSFTRSKYFRNLPPIAMLLDLERLVHAGYELRLITQVPVKSQYEARMLNILTMFGLDMYKELVLKREPVFVENSFDKEEYIMQSCKEYDQVVVVEDNPTTLDTLSRRSEWLLRKEGETPLQLIGIVHEYNRQALDALFWVTPACDFEQATGIILTY